jgi:hypothetical protein
MTDYKNHGQASNAVGEGRVMATLVARVTNTERAEIAELARIHDRTPSREIRRAIRFYVANFDLADRVLREQANQPSKPAGGLPR